MRKFNAFLSMGIFVLFLIHAIAGGFQLFGIIAGGSNLLSVLSWIMITLILIHTIIGVKLTADTLVSIKKSGVSYFKENKLFWTRRISGFAVMLFIACHLIIFIGSNDGAYRLNLFGNIQLVSQLLLVLSLAVHVMSNIKPLMISLGTRGLKDIAIDVMFTLSVILLFTGIAFVVYYLRWNVF